MRPDLCFSDLRGQVTVGPTNRVGVGMAELLGDDNQGRSSLNKLARIGAVKGTSVEAGFAPPDLLP